MINIKPFENNIHNFTHIGYLMKCFYHVYYNNNFEKSIQFSMGFNGYIDNLNGVYNNIINKKVCFANFNKEKPCKLNKQYYPPLINDNPVTNTCSFDNSNILGLKQVSIFLVFIFSYIMKTLSIIPIWFADNPIPW